MNGWAIFFIILLLIWLFWGPVKRWLQKCIIRYLHRRLFGNTGPFDQAYRRTKKSGRNYRHGYGDRREDDGYPAESVGKMMKEVAEDVEFTETKEFGSSDRSAPSSEGKTEYYRESQVSDAEWVEIKDEPDKKRH